jgi:hypothetical protein
MASATYLRALPGAGGQIGTERTASAPAARRVGQAPGAGCRRPARRPSPAWRGLAASLLIAAGYACTVLAIRWALASL